MAYPGFIFFCAFLFFSIFLSPAISQYDLLNDFTLYGDAHLVKDAISLTQEPSPSSLSSSNGVGRALHTQPIRFRDPSANTTASFYCRFIFTIIPSPNSSSSAGDGLTFLITSNSTSASTSSGYMGLPSHTNSTTQESFLAVEFDTSLDPNLGDINDNHIGIDVNTVVSLASVGVNSTGIDLKSGKNVTAYVGYDDAEKIIHVWASYSPYKPLDPVLSTHIDLSNGILKEFMYIGFSASNGLGFSQHRVEFCIFMTYGLVAPSIPVWPGSVAAIPPTNEGEEEDGDDCC